MLTSIYGALALFLSVAAAAIIYLYWMFRSLDGFMAGFDVHP